MIKRMLAIMALSGLAALAGCPEPPVLPEGNGELWLRFAHVTDTHVLDDESPARVVRLANLFYASWRPQDAYTAQVLDAMIHVLNAYHTGALLPRYRLDFVLHTGDTVDNAQHNELQWFMDTMEGRVVTPDSGALDGVDRPVAPEDNPKLAFQAEGLLPEIPWYVMRGNHDTLCVGNFAIDHSSPYPVEWTAPLLGIVAGAVGLHEIDGCLNALSPTMDISPAVILGDMDLADPVTMKLRRDLIMSGPIPPDLDRQFIDKDRFAQTMLDSPSLPPGHGFGPDSRWGSSLCYSVRPKADVPIRLIALDTVASSPPAGLPAYSGVLLRDTFERFFKPAVETAQAAGEWVIVATHQPSGDFDVPYPARKVGTREFRNYLASQPNVILHLCGHTHRNHYQVIDGPHPYPEIETCSLIDYPQEARIVEIYYLPETHNFQVKSRMVSPRADASRLADESFRRALLDNARVPGGETAAKEGTLELEDLFPLDAASLDALKQRESTSAEERLGRPGDREFSVTVR